MTEETYKKAGKLKREIEELQSLISSLSYRKQAANRGPDHGRRPWWVMRALNLKSTPEKSEEAHIIIFDNVHTHGTDIKVDEELLDLLTNYFEGKKKEKEKEFDALS